MVGHIDLKNMNKAEVLAKLFNASCPAGLGLFLGVAPDMTVHEAQALLDQGTTYFDYLKGRVLKIDLSQDTLDPFLYNRDNGYRAAEKALGLD